MPLQSVENRGLDALMAQFTLIGTPPSAWLTVPEVHEGVPPDRVEVKPTTPLVYLQVVRTAPTEANAGTATHKLRVNFVAWVFATEWRTVHNLKADLLRALWAGEGAFTTLFGQPVWDADFAARDDMAQSGIAAGALSMFVDLDVDHDKP